MRGLLFAVLLIIGMQAAAAEEWAARHGICYEWEARWDVQQEPTGVWIGFIDFLHVGGPCAAGNRQVLTYEVRAAIVGGDFFARRTMGTTVCHLHGHIRGDEVRGVELCSSLPTPFQFAIRFDPQRSR